MRRAYLIVVAAALILGLALVALSVPPVLANDNDRDGPKVFDRNSVAYGRTYSEWSAAWWQWAFSIPVASHPLFGNGDCSIGQSGPVWFLGGRFCISGDSNCNGTATRSCTVPAGEALYFPLGNVEDSAPEEPNWGCGNNLPPLLAGTIAEMRQCAASFVNATNLEADVDGRQIRNLSTNFRVQSVEFEVTWPSDNVLNAIGEGPFPAGTYSPVVDDGFYVLLAPLPVGNHTLHFQSGPPPNGQNITYHLTVTK